MYCAMVALLISVWEGGGEGLVVVFVEVGVGVSGGFALGTVGFGIWDGRWDFTYRGNRLTRL